MSRDAEKPVKPEATRGAVPQKLCPGLHLTEFLGHKDNGNQSDYPLCSWKVTEKKNVPVRSWKQG